VTSTRAAVAIGPLDDGDRARWELLARGYKAFYATEIADAEVELAWQRLVAGDAVHALGARLDGTLVGIAHFFFHPTVWLGDACHLQDLFVDPAARNRGVARALIEAVAATARERGAFRLYWHTHTGNATARALYDKVARHIGMIRYDLALDTTTAA
jgi:GNAT superfamily N-acetyltransferase